MAKKRYHSKHAQKINRSYKDSLFYFSELYQNYLKAEGLRLTGTGRRLLLPLPRYIVFYNGTKDEPDETQLLLSDSFPEPKGGGLPALECRAQVLNINSGHNQEIMKRCHRLKEYSEFIGEIRCRLQSGLKLEDAVEQGIEACIRRGVLSDILSRSKMEVRKMLLTEYDEKAEREYLQKQSREEGLKEGLEEGLQEGIRAFILDNLEEQIPETRILSKLERRFSLTPEQAKEYFEKYAEGC